MQYVAATQYEAIEAAQCLVLTVPEQSHRSATGEVTVHLVRFHINDSDFAERIAKGLQDGCLGVKA